MKIKPFRIFLVIAFFISLGILSANMNADTFYCVPNYQNGTIQNLDCNFPFNFTRLENFMTCANMTANLTANYTNQINNLTDMLNNCTTTRAFYEKTVIDLGLDKSNCTLDLMAQKESRAGIIKELEITASDLTEAKQEAVDCKTQLNVDKNDYDNRIENLEKEIDDTKNTYMFYIIGGMLGIVVVWEAWLRKVVRGQKETEKKVSERAGDDSRLGE